MGGDGRRPVQEEGVLAGWVLLNSRPGSGKHCEFECAMS